MESSKRRILCIVVLLCVVFAGMPILAQSETLQRSYILETHPVSWLLFGANADVEINTGRPMSFVAQYQHYGNESPFNKDIEDDPEIPETFSGNNFIFGIRIYNAFEEKGMDCFYYGIALDYVSVKYTTRSYYDYSWFSVETELQGFGPRVELGWRWLWPSNKITLRLGFFASYHFLKKTQKGYPDFTSDPDEDIDEDKKMDEESAQFLMGMITNVRAGMEFAVGFAF